jgi:hypothetical protein
LGLDSVPQETWVLASAVHQPDSSLAVRLNTGGSATAKAALPNNIGRFSNVLGRTLYEGCSSWIGAISEVLVYRRALSPEERGATEEYLQLRHGCCR